MRGFQKELDHFLARAVEAELLPASAAAELASFARGAFRPQRSGLQLAAVLGWLGGLAVALGVILLVAANWKAIPDSMKIAGLLVLLGGAHALGLRLARSAPRTADALHFLGGGLFLAGIGLIGQIYHLDPDPPGTVLLWLLGVAPLACWLASPSLTLQAACALLLWMHLLGSQPGAALEMPDAASAHLCLELGLGAAFVGLGAALRRRAPEVARMLRGLGVLLLFVLLYLLGFWRHMAEHRTPDGSPVLPLLALGAGALGLGLGASWLAADARALRPRLVLLLGATLALGATALAADLGWIPRGREWGLLQFGQRQDFAASAWLLSIGAWVVWFALGLWSIAFGVRTQQSAWVNLGVLAFGLGIVTRFFDLIGTLRSTGIVYVLGGGVLLATAWLSERWRRRLTMKMEAGR